MTRDKSVQNFIIPSLRVLYVERIEICCNFIDILTFKYLKGHFWENMLSLERYFMQHLTLSLPENIEVHNQTEMF